MTCDNVTHRRDTCFMSRKEIVLSAAVATDETRELVNGWL